MVGIDERRITVFRKRDRVGKKVDTKKCYIIVNDKVEEKDVPIDCVITDGNGLKYFCDDYGTGSIWWPIIDSPSGAYERYLVENVKWAKDRLPWAMKGSPGEVDGLLAIIKNKGKGRNKLWQKKLKGN